MTLSGVYAVLDLDDALALSRDSRRASGPARSVDESAGGPYSSESDAGLSFVESSCAGSTEVEYGGATVESEAFFH